MKRLILASCLCLIVLSGCTSQRNINNFYNKYQGTENTLSFKAPMFLASFMFQNNKEMSAFREKVKSIRFLSMDDLNNHENSQINNEINQALQQDGFDSWFNMNKDGRVINISTQNRGNSLKNIVVAVQGEESMTFINAKTDLTEKELTKFISMVLDSDKKDKD